MKTSHLLPLCAALAVAHEIHSHDPSIGYCHSPILKSFPLLSRPVCSSETLITRYQAVDSHSPANRAWTRASSCIANGTGNQTEEFCIFLSSTFAEGRGLAVLTSPDRAEYIAELPAFTNPSVLEGFNKDPAPEVAKFKKVHVPGKGMGVIATQPYQRGDHIMTFTPAIIIDYGAFRKLPEQDIRRLQAEAIDYLPSSLRSGFLNLSTHDGADGHLERVEKILRTNAFDVEINDDDDERLYVVFPEISRFNHDCRPNADYYFDPLTLAQHVQAARPIAIGEEISVTYIDPLRPRRKRLQQLESTWGFQCGCSLCTQSSEMGRASDKRIKQIATLRKHLEDYTQESAATPQMADLVVSLYQQERLDLSIHEAFTFAAIEWNGVGEPWNAVRNARLAIQHGLASAGPTDHDVIEMQRLAEDPWGHWSWMLRTSRRMSWGNMRVIGTRYRRGEEDEDDEDDDDE